MQEPVEYWKWISDSKLALVTATSVYHWSIEGKLFCPGVITLAPAHIWLSSCFLPFLTLLPPLLLFLISFCALHLPDNAKPVKIFQRHQNLVGSQIINYRVDKTDKWCALIGIARKDDKIAGYMQLYSIERKMSQAIDGHAAAFASYVTEGSTKPSTLFCFAARTPQVNCLCLNYPLQEPVSYFHFTLGFQVVHSRSWTARRSAFCKEADRYLFPCRSCSRLSRGDASQ